MKVHMRNHLYIFYAAVLLLHLSNVFLNIHSLEYVIGLLAIVMIAISFIDASKLFKILGSIFLICGGAMYIQAEVPLIKLPLFMTSNMPLLAFFAVLPWINSAVHVGKYDQRVNELLKENVDHLGKLYGRSLLTSFTLVTFLNLSAINLSQNILSKNLEKVDEKIRNSFISKTTLRAFCLALIWSPMEIAVAIIVDYTEVNYLIYLPWLLLIAIIVLFIDRAIGKLTYQSIPYEAPYTDENELSSMDIYKKVLKLFLALLLFLSTVIGVGHLFQLNFILTVTLVIIPFSALWAIVMKRWNYFRVLAWDVWKRHMNHMQNFVILFTSLAFFSNSLNATAVLDVIQKPFFIFSEYPLIIFIFVLFTYFIMAMLGVHPIATIGILLEVLSPLFNVFNPISIGIVLIVSALATSGSGTYGIAVTMTSINTKQSPYRITLRNLPFTFLMGSVGIMVAYFLL
ncbi:hypothetical protein ACLIBG_09820 [Virgibacillus sp. W0181]|uniref:hypothetical protein n=1 Tax=Virgibacillus sp. W0181 TaxID=3391581 RepID=UPI003F459AFF